MHRFRKAALADVVGVGGDRVEDRGREVGVLLHEARRRPVVETQQVVPDEHLAVGLRTRADPDRGDAQPLGDLRGHRRRNRLEHDREAARRLERTRVVQQAAGLVGGAALCPESAERGGGLRRQADVAHHRHTGPDDRLGAGERRACSLELDGVRAGLLDEPDRVGDRVCVRHLEGAERHVGDHERAPRAARHGPREDDHLVHRRGHRRIVAEHGHRGRVADEDQVDAGGVRETPRGRVVRRHHHDRLVALLHGASSVIGSLPGAGVPGAGVRGRVLTIPPRDRKARCR